MGLAVLCIISLIVRFFTYNTTVNNLISCGCCVFSSMILLFFLCIKDGYDARLPGKKIIDTNAVFSIVLSVCSYILITVICRYYTGAATNVCVIAQLIGNIDSLTDIKVMAREHGGLMFVSLVIQTVPFIPAMIGGYVYGGHKRKQSRMELIK